MTCRKLRSAWWTFRLPAAEKLGEIQSHLAACDRCAREYAAIQAAANLIQPQFRVQPSRISRSVS